MKNLYLKFRPSVRHLSALCLTLIILLGSGCQSSDDPVEIVFGFNEDPTNTLQPILDSFNEINKEKIKVVWEQIPGTTDDLYREVENDFKSGSNKFDVIGADLIWTATLASNGWVEDLSSKFFSAYNPEDFVEAALNSASYQFRMWGIPWYTDAGMLFYRKDLLEANGIDNPPLTWNELKNTAKKITAASGVKNGFVFQGGNYEGGVTNACEFIWNAGGSILIGNLSISGNFDVTGIDPNVITVNSKEAQTGLEAAYNLIQDGIAPKEVADFREVDGLNIFKNGDAVFYRGWPSMYGGFFGEDSKIKPEQIGVTSLPVTEEILPSYSCLGGWNLMINANITEAEKEAAWTFIKYMADAKRQRYRALEGGILPSLRALYNDQVLVNKVPVISLAKKVIANTRERPISPYYMEISPEIASVYHRVLKGEITAAEGISVLDSKLNNLLALHR